MTRDTSDKFLALKAIQERALILWRESWKIRVMDVDPYGSTTHFKPFGPQADEGGESIAMDGFAAAESLYQQDPQVPKTALSSS